MSSLKTHLQKNTIRDNKALQGVFTKDCDNCAGWGSCKKSTCHKCLGSGKMPKDKITIADVIDNAESLFGYARVCSICNQEHKMKEGLKDGVVSMYSHRDDKIMTKYKFNSVEILVDCFDNKPLKDIEDYIIKNLK